MAMQNNDKRTCWRSIVLGASLFASMLAVLGCIGSLWVRIVSYQHSYFGMLCSHGATIVSYRCSNGLCELVVFRGNCDLVGQFVDEQRLRVKRATDGRIAHVEQFMDQGPTNVFSLMGIVLQSSPVQVRYPTLQTPEKLHAVRSTRLYRYSVQLPMWIAAILFLLYPLTGAGKYIIVRAKKNRRRRRGRCVECGYDIRGSPGACCSECGSPIATGTERGMSRMPFS